jgi:hypothetical protein
MKPATIGRCPVSSATLGSHPTGRHARDAKRTTELILFPDYFTAIGHQGRKCLPISCQVLAIVPDCE